MNTLTGYVPYDYRRLCDLCGNPWNRSKLHRQGPYMVCPDHAGERISEALDRGNARQRPFRVLPVPNAKPEDQLQPDVFEAQQSEIFTLLNFANDNGGRYAQVQSGMSTVLPDAADAVTTNAWACLYFYGLGTATYPRGHVDVWGAQALTRLRAAADVLLARQVYTNRDTDPFHGGFLGLGTTTYFCEDAAIGGLGALYAFRAFGDAKYLLAARAAASFLRNLQAIGSDGTNFTSSNSAGTIRLYTGAITNAVSSVAGFYADHRFYASSLLALWFWNELRLTDGDQSLGANAVIAGSFDTAPAKALSRSMADLRAFWETGVYDVTAKAVRTGLSVTTPAEFFNAFPATKPNASAAGTGSWEFRNGGASTGTTITSLYIAKALAALFAVDGLSAQVTAIDDWLRSFTSNPAYARASSISARDKARVPTGTYDATMGIAKHLLVRDVGNAYAPIKMNGGALYDWGAFGLLAPIWSTRNALGFKNGRFQATVKRRRLSDGLPSDGDWDDWLFIRGRSGLTYQTDHFELLDRGGGAAL